MMKPVLVVTVAIGLGFTALGCSWDDQSLQGGLPARPGVTTDGSPGEGQPTSLSRFQKAEGDTAPAAPEPAAPASAEAIRGVPVARIRVLVNTSPIFDEEIRQACGNSLREADRLEEPERSQRKAEIFQKTVDYLVDQELLLQDAHAKFSGPRIKVLDQVKALAAKEFDKQVHDNMQRAGIKTEDDFKKILQTQGISMEGMRRQIERTFIAQEYLRSQVMRVVDQSIGHEQLWDYYQKHKEEFQIADSVQWQSIFIDNSKFDTRDAAYQTAVQVAQRWRAGQDYASLAQFNDGDSKFRQGQGEGSRRGEIKPAEVEAVLFQLHDGEVGPLAELPTGFYIMRLVKREFAGIRPFDEKTQDVIRDKLRSEIANRESKRIMASLREKAKVQLLSNEP
jgi:hypothetical protein